MCKTLKKEDRPCLPKYSNALYAFLLYGLTYNNEVKLRYRKIPKISPGAYIFQRPFFGGAYIRRGLSTKGNLRFELDRASLIVGSKLPFFLCSTLYLRAIFQVQAPGGLIFGGAI